MGEKRTLALSPFASATVGLTQNQLYARACAEAERQGLNIANFQASSRLERFLLITGRPSRGGTYDWVPFEDLAGAAAAFLGFTYSEERLHCMWDLGLSSNQLVTTLTPPITSRLRRPRIPAVKVDGSTRLERLAEIQNSLVGLSWSENPYQTSTDLDVPRFILLSSPSSGAVGGVEGYVLAHELLVDALMAVGEYAYVGEGFLGLFDLDSNLYSVPVPILIQCDITTTLGERSVVAI